MKTYTFLVHTEHKQKGGRKEKRQIRGDKSIPSFNDRLAHSEQSADNKVIGNVHNT